MKRLFDAIKERPNLLTKITLLVLVPLALITHRSLAQFFAGVMLLAIVMMLAFPKRTSPVVVYNLSMMLAIVGLLSPLDVTVRCSDRFGAGFARIIHTSNPEHALQKTAAKGLKENVDFVLYEWAGSFLGPYWAIVFTAPCGSKSWNTR